MQVRSPVAADFRFRGRSGDHARRADDHSGVGKLGSEMCGLRNRASPSTHAESGSLPLQMRSPLRTHLAGPVAKGKPRVRRLLADVTVTTVARSGFCGRQHSSSARLEWRAMQSRVDDADLIWESTESAIFSPRSKMCIKPACRGNSNVLGKECPPQRKTDDDQSDEHGHPPDCHRAPQNQPPLSAPKPARGLGIYGKPPVDRFASIMVAGTLAANIAALCFGRLAPTSSMGSHVS